MSAEISKAKQKRLDRAQSRKNQKAKKAMVTFWSIVIPLALILSVVAAVVVYQRSKLNYSKYLTNEGKIRNINASDYVHVDYETFSFNKADLMPADEVIDNDIAYAISSHSSVSEDTSLQIKDGDRVQLYYNVKVNDEIVSSATAETGGRTMTIGNADMTADFDKALTGRHPGDAFSQEITFPEDYSDPTLAGTTALIETTIGGIYVDPVFDDEFVMTYYSDVAATAAGYRQNLIDNYYKQSLQEAISNAIDEKSTITSYPEAYMENMKKVVMEQDKQQMESYNNMYMQYTGSPIYTNVYEMFGYASEAEYQTRLVEESQKRTADALKLQYIYEKAGLTNPESDVKAYFSNMGYDDATFAQLQEEYGFGYLAQSVLSQKVLEYLEANVAITE